MAIHIVVTLRSSVRFDPHAADAAATAANIANYFFPSPLSGNQRARNAEIIKKQQDIFLPLKKMGAKCRGLIETHAFSPS